MADGAVFVWLLEKQEEFQVWSTKGLFSSLEALLAHVERQKFTGDLKAVPYYVDRPDLVVRGAGRVLWTEGRPLFKPY